MKQKHKRLVRQILQTLRLEKPVRFVYRRWLQFRLYRQHGSVQEVTFEVAGANIRFSTADLYSRRLLLGSSQDLYEAHITSLIAPYLKTCRSFADVGAHIGYYTCIAGCLSPDARIYAFEMDRANYTLLTKNIVLNHLTNVEAHAVAVTNADGEAQYIKETDAASSGFELSSDAARDSRFGVLVPVKSVTLDSFFTEQPVPPDVIKIDVEGAELLVLEGMKQLLEASSPRIFVEIHPEKLQNFNATVTQVLALLFRYGYQIQEHQKLSASSVRDLSPDSTVSHNHVLHAWKV